MIPLKIPQLQYSKSSNFYLDSKKDYFIKNEELLKIETERNRLYSQQGLRLNCKICKEDLPKEVDFQQHSVTYKFCTSCGHLNGSFEDTKLFSDIVYNTEYSADYIDNDFEKRCIEIYKPKVDFLINNLNIKEYKVLDIGCGCGYFVYAAIKANIQATGIDIGSTMVKFGNDKIASLINSYPLKNTQEEEFYDSIIKSDSNIISAIGVIEHLRSPHLLFEAFKRSNARFIYYSVPMFSLSVILENLFSRTYPRQLSGGHTHLFTEKSLKKMNSLIGVSSIAEWRFGTDMMDFYRHCQIELKNNNVSENLLSIFENEFIKNIDSLQSTFDKSHFCSEIHVLASKF